DGTYRYASPSHRRILGYGPAEVQGRNVFELMHPDDLPHTQAAFAALMQSPGAMETAEFRMRHADGSWRTLEGIGTNRLHDPALRGVIANARDITERKRAEADRVILLAREQAARQVAEAREHRAGESGVGRGCWRRGRRARHHGAPAGGGGATRERGPPARGGEQRPHRALRPRRGGRLYGVRRPGDAGDRDDPRQSRGREH